MLLDQLPNELLWHTLSYLEYDDITILQSIEPIAQNIQHYIQHHYKFHYKVNSLLLLFEAITPTERQLKDTKAKLSQQLLGHICKEVEKVPKLDHRSKFTELLDTAQRLVLERILSLNLKAGLEHDYANLCLEIRSVYLHTPSIRVLHDPKYRRRSTKHPLAPFLPRDYTYVWRQHCSSLPHTPIHARFATFFGALFDVTSLYLESNLDSSFEECAREALVTGNVEDLLILCVAADRPVDVDHMCSMVTHAGEQLRQYLETMETWVTTHPTPQQELRMRQQQETTTQHEPPPDWLIPDRYKVNPDNILRLKLMNYLYRKGWRWFQ